MAKNWAIAIGINEYEHLSRPLEYAQRDAQMMRDWLQNRAGFEKVYYYADNSPKIGNTSTRPTYSNLLRLLDERFEKPFMGAGDNFWFFFSGHGVRHEGQDYLMAADSYTANIPKTAIPVSYVLGQLRRCGADNIVLLLDACRDNGGKSAEGMGRETAQQAQQMGVISIASCSPNELSYEVEALGQGVFTYALLEGLGVQGRCATVERLDAYLARRVPQLNREHGKRIQTPLTTAEPIDRAHLILVPEYATLSDVATLKLDAYRAAEDGNRELARQLWIRVLGASPADLEAVTALERLASTPEPSPAPRRQTSRRQSKSPRIVSSVYTHRGTQTRSPTPGVTRRQLMQWSLWGGAGLGLATVGNAIFQGMESDSPISTPSPTPTPKPTPTPEPTPEPTLTPEPPSQPSELAFETFSFDVITVNEKGEEID
ncbi:caspase family protein, partial [Oscillatoriales cyanobacterium LEGE 11467]